MCVCVGLNNSLSFSPASCWEKTQSDVNGRRELKIYTSGDNNQGESADPGTTKGGNSELRCQATRVIEKGT